MRRSRNQQGVVAVMMALIITVVMIPIAALAVDIGMQRVARRDMQSLADVVALDLARQLDGTTSAAALLSAFNGLSGLAAKSAARNMDTVGDNDARTVVAEVGTVNPAYYGKPGYFTAVSGDEKPNAVRVTASTEVGFGLARALPGGGVTSGSASRSAVATSESSACFDLGSYAAALDSGDSSLLAPFNSLLGLNLDLLSYKGLAGASLSLADLAADSYIGSVDTLLGGNVTLGNFTAAAIDVLNNQNKPGNAVAIGALQAIQTSGIDLSKKVDVGKFVSLQSNDSAALKSEMNILDLISGAIQVANGEHGVDISSLNIAGITGGLDVTQGITRACGTANSPKAKATASQVDANLQIPLPFPGGPGVLGLAVTGNVDVSGGIGNAQGRLVSPPAVVCAAGTIDHPDTYRVDVNSGLLGLGLQTTVNINGTVSTGLLGGLLDSLLGAVVKIQFNDVGFTLGAGAPGTSPSVQHADLKVPQNAINTSPRGTPVATGSAFGGLGTVPPLTTATPVSGSIVLTTTRLLGLGTPKQTTIDLSRGGAVGGLIATLLSTVNAEINTTVNGSLVPTLNNLLTPLGKILGVNTGGADVYSESRPTCNGARLAG